MQTQTNVKNQDVRVGAGAGAGVGVGLGINLTETDSISIWPAASIQLDRSQPILYKTHLHFPPTIPRSPPSRN